MFTIKLASLLTLFISLFSFTFCTSFWQPRAADPSSFAMLAGLNQTCATNTTCSSSNPNSYCAKNQSTDTEGICSCLPKHIPYKSLKENCDFSLLAATTTADENEIESCLPVIDEFNEKCSVHEQCMQGAFGELGVCLEGYCRCPPNTTHHDYYSMTMSRSVAHYYSGETLAPLLFGDYCVPLATNLGDPCFVLYLEECRDIPFSQCELFEFGNRGTCECQSGTVASSTEPNTCIEATPSIGGQCKTDNNCRALLNSKCEVGSGPLAGTCQCINASYVLDKLNTGCVELVHNLNVSCSVNEQCQVENSVCIRETPGQLTTCTCMPGFVQSSTNADTCVNIVNTISTECKEDIQCQTGLGAWSECSNGFCHCKNIGTSQRGKCYPLRSLGEQCELTAQCDSSIAPVFLTCALDSAEKEDPTYRCQCRPESHLEYNGTCYRISGFGKSCETDEQCWASSSVGADSLFVCDPEKSNTCGCPPDYMANSDETKCIRESVPLGEECQETRQCSTMTDNTFCKRGYPNACECKAGYRNETVNVCNKVSPTTTTTSNPNSGTHLVAKLGRVQLTLMLFMVTFILANVIYFV